MRRLVAAIAVVLLAGMAVARAADYPNRPITLVIPYAAGGTTDVIGRIIAEGLRSRLGQPVILLNKPGGSGQLGLEFAAAAQPDGYTLVVANNALTAGPVVNKSYKLNTFSDFTHIILIAEGHDLLLSSPQLPISNAADLVKLAKAHPGELNIASWAPSIDLNIGMLMQRAGIDLVRVPYRGSTPAMMALMTNEVQLVLSGNPLSREFISAQKIRAVGVASLKPYPLAPSMPLLSETGIPNYEARGAWFGLSGPKGMPAAVVNQLNNAMNEALQTQLAQEQIVKGMAHEIIGGTPEEFIAALHTDVTFFSEAARITNFEAK
jgi:tripartite-type tricarboxylate transporter receptor subunit TctC